MAFDIASPEQRAEPEAPQRATTMNLVPRDLPPPAQMAQLLAVRPDRNEVLMQLHQTAGNSYVQEVLAAAEPASTKGMFGAAEGTPADTPPLPDAVVMVKIPAQPTQGSVCEAILRGPTFGFQDADLAAFKLRLAADPDFFYLSEPTSEPASVATAVPSSTAKATTASKHATPAQIAAWANPQTHLATITIKGSVVAALEALKASRARGSVDAALMTADPALGKALHPVLLALLGPGGDARNTAAQDLALLIESGDNASTIAGILDTLQAKGNGKDPLIPMLRGLANAKAARVPKDFIGPVTSDVDPARAAKAEAQGDEARADLRAQRETGGENRAEGAVMFGLLERLDRLTGNREGANEAALMARYYRVDDQERATVKRTHATSIERTPPTDGPAMRARSKLDDEFEDLRAKEEAFQAGSENEKASTEIPENSKSHTPLPIETRGQSSEWLEAKRAADEKLENEYVGAVALINASFGFVGMLYRMDEGTRLIAERDLLNRRAWAEAHYPVPPPIADLDRLLRIFEREVAKGGPHAEAARHDLVKVERVRELAGVFYNLPR